MTEPMPLPEPVTAYWVRSFCVLPITVEHSFHTPHKAARFLVGEAVYQEQVTPWGDLLHQTPAPGRKLALDVRASEEGHPFKHPNVRWSLEAAATRFRELWLFEANLARKRAQGAIATAERIEAVDHYKMVMGESKPETYISPFTNEEV